MIGMVFVSSWWLVADQVLKMLYRPMGLAELNSGGVLGGFKEWRGWLIIGLAVLVGLMLMMLKKRFTYGETVGLMFIFFSGLSNLIDRIFWGGVWDYICYPLVNICGNLADIGLWFGVGIIFWVEIRKKEEKSR